MRAAAARVQQIEVPFHRAVLSGAVGNLEPGLVRGPVHRHRGVVEVQSGTVAFDVLHQRGYEFRNAEQHCTGRAEVDLDILQYAVLAPVIAGQVHGLLRCAGTLDRHGWLGKQRLAAAQVLHQLPV